MTSDHTITSCQMEGGKVEAVTDLTFLGSQITADGDCSHEIKRHLLLARKSMTNLVLAAQLCLTFVTPLTVAHQALLSMKFSRQEYCSGLPFPSPMHESEK